MNLAGFVKIKNYTSDQSGLTLMEMIVSLAIFSVVTVSAMGIFQSVVSGQSYAIASLNTQETLRYDFEMMSKELRTVKKTAASCDSICTSLATVNPVYYTNATSDVLCFTNEKNNCVKYYLDGGRLKINRFSVGDYPVTPNEVVASELMFKVNISSLQPRVTMKLKVEAIGKEIDKQALILQQTISVRIYDEMYD
jgi:prepilin-type N-terminal cleavage/methylation domain-containing protein